MTYSVQLITGDLPFADGRTIFLSIIYLRLVMKNCAGGRVNLIVVLPIAGLELYFINNCAVLYIQLNVHVIDRVRIHTGVVQHNGFCLSVANVLRRSGLCGLCRLSLRCFVVIRRLPLGPRP